MSLRWSHFLVLFLSPCTDQQVGLAAWDFLDACEAIVPQVPGREEGNLATAPCVLSRCMRFLAVETMSTQEKLECYFSTSDLLLWSRGTSEGF